LWALLTTIAYREDNSATILLCDLAMKKIVLASASPRRRELLEQTGLRFEVEPTDYDEETTSASEPHEIARELSLGKARAAARKHRKALVIAADTLVVLGDRIIGKPHTNAQARDMLRALNGKAHSVITGFTVLDTETGKVLSKSVETRVHMKKLTLKEIDSYVRTKEPLDKAGGYAIQGWGAALVDRIEGDFSNVVGLPLSALADSLSGFGVKVL
jgi:nucleoside triphosphate pyrophosphatase